jgi:hypothetical protein
MKITYDHEVDALYIRFKETYDHHERPHQGMGNVVLLPAADHGKQHGSIPGHERLGGLLQYDAREAACVFWPSTQ